MADQRKGGISWTSETWNPIRGCSRVNQSCVNCYAEAMAIRFSGKDMPYHGLVRLSNKDGAPLGWNGKVGRERCEHSPTDGTIDCGECGKTASEFISAAVKWLDRHCGNTFRGKGEEYFDC